MQKFVEDIYSKYYYELDMFGSTPEHYDDNDRNYYVYAWFTKTNPKKFFYIGRGTKERYNHILQDIKLFENGKKEKGYHYKILKDNLGIDFEFLYDNLTHREAVILEAYTLLILLEKGEPLLNIITPYLSDDIEEKRWNMIKEKDINKFLDYYKK